MSTDIPPVDLVEVSAGAYDCAYTLLDAFYYQDNRESHLLRGDAMRACEAESVALDRMTTAFEREFPHVAAAHAQAAGKAFMNALFLQDEIENWDFLRQQPNRDRIGAVLRSDVDAAYGTSPVDDSRWASVEALLGEACASVRIDGRYAETQARFWKLHGQLAEYWEEDAVEAQRIKLRAMVPGAPEDALEDLAGHFVEGVKMHDGWSHRDKEQDYEDLADLVASYYQRVFDLRAAADRRRVVTGDE